MKVLNRKSTFSLLFVFLLAIAVISTVKLTNVKATNNPGSERNLYYTNIEIQPGDTLISIAEEYITPEYASVEEYVKEIMEFNGLSDDKIYSGNYLVVMYYSDEVK